MSAVQVRKFKLVFFSVATIISGIILFMSFRQIYPAVASKDTRFTIGIIFLCCGWLLRGHILSYNNIKRW